MLRAPIGKYNVGIRNIDTDEFGDNEYRRKLSLMFFYPSDEIGEECPYMDAEYQRNAGNGYYDNGVRTYCYKDVPISNCEDKYPVVVYNHGLNGYQMESTVLCADIASSGYIVISVGHPYGSGAVTYEDGSVLVPNDSFVIERNNLAPLGTLWYEDIQYAIKYIGRLNSEDVPNRNNWGRRLNLDEGINLLGISFGGCCSVGTILMENEIRCAINLDGGLFADISCLYPNKPILVMCSPLNYKAHVRLKELGCTNVTVKKIRKLSHWEFSDGVYFSERGKKDRNRADIMSKQRAVLCLEFLQKNTLSQVNGCLGEALNTCLKEIGAIL